MTESELGNLRTRLWAESRLVRECIERDGISSYVRSLSNLSDAFRPGDRALRCIDGRTPGGARLAGSGVLLGLEKAKAFAQAAQCDRITYHEDCGAARAWAQEHSRDVSEATTCAREFAEELAQALGVPCSETPLVGPPGFHDEAIIYYDGTELANPARVSGLPKGFVISRAYFGDDFPAALEQVKLAASTALGEHGFGELFTPEHPLRVVAVGHPQNAHLSVQQLAQELGLLELPAPERVVIEGFAARL
jgi:hypothetical protein